MRGFEVVAVALSGFGVSWVLIWLRLRLRGGLDHPNERSLHAVPTPHGGGIGILAAALAACVYLRLAPVWPVALLVLGGLSWLDDWKPLPFAWRLAVHLGMATLVVAQSAPPHLWAWLVLILAVGWMTNAYNFMDGANGLAGSMAACGFLAYALAFAWGGQVQYALWCIAIAAAALAFLTFNWDPARIFMGDVGSIPLGFLAGALGWLGVARDVWPLWFPLTVFAPFLADASLTLLRRARREAKLWQAHREHLYQRMVQSGMSHGTMCVRWLYVMLAGCMVALLLCSMRAPIAWAGASAWWLVLLWLGWMAEQGIRARRGD